MCHRIGIKSYVSNVSFGRRPTPPVSGMAGSPSEPIILDGPKIAKMAATVRQAQGELFAGSKICWAPKYVPTEHYSVMTSTGRNVEIHGRHSTS